MSERIAEKQELKQVVFKLPAAVIEALRTIAYQERTSKSAAARQMIYEALTARGVVDLPEWPWVRDREM